jgi:hypothetical protein
MPVLVAAASQPRAVVSMRWACASTITATITMSVAPSGSIDLGVTPTPLQPSLPQVGSLDLRRAPNLEIHDHISR